MCFIFIDESGDLGYGSKYLVLSALFVEDEKQFNRIIKNMRRNKFKKQLKKASEIKANKSSKELITHMLKKLNTIEDASVFYVILEKKKLYSNYLKGNKHKLYNFVAGKLAKNLTLDDLNVVIRIDKSKGKQLLRDDFNKYFLKLLSENSRNHNVELYHSYSHSFSGLQFADVLAWSCFQKFERNNSEYVDYITLDQEVYHVW